MKITINRDPTDLRLGSPGRGRRACIYGTNYNDNYYPQRLSSPCDARRLVMPSLLALRSMMMVTVMVMVMVR